MWGDFLRNAAEQAQNIVGKVDELANKGIAQATNLLETLDGLGDEEGGGSEREEGDDGDRFEEGERDEIEAIPTDGSRLPVVEDNEPAAQSASNDWPDLSFTDDIPPSIDTPPVEEPEIRRVQPASKGKSKVSKVTTADKEASKEPQPMTVSAPIQHPSAQEIKSEITGDSSAPEVSTPSSANNEANLKERKLQRALKKLEKEKSKVDEELLLSQQENSSLHNVIVDLQDQVSLIPALQQELSDLKLQNEDFERLIAMKQDGFQAERDTWHKERQELQQQLQKQTAEQDQHVVQQVHALQHQVEVLAKETQQWHDKHDEIRLLYQESCQQVEDMMKSSVDELTNSQPDFSFMQAINQQVLKLKAEQSSMREEAQALHSAFLSDLLSTQEQLLQHVSDVQPSDEHQHHLEMIKALKHKYDDVVSRSEALEEGHKVAVLELVQQHKRAVDELKKVKDKYQQYTQEIMKLEQSNHDLEQQLCNASKLAVDEEEHPVTEEWPAKYQQLQQEQDEWISKCNALEQQVEDLRSQLEAVSTQHVEKYNQVVEESKQQETSYEAQLAALQAQLDNLEENKAAALSASNDTEELLTSEIAALQLKLDAAEAQLIGEHQRFEAEQEKVASLLAEKETQLENLKGELQEAQAQTQVPVQEAEEKVVDTEVEDSLRAEISSLQEKLSTVEAQLAAEQQSIEEKVTALTSLLADKETQLESIKKELQAAMQAQSIPVQEGVEDKVADTEVEEGLRAEIASLQEKLSTVEAQLIADKQEIEEKLQSEQDKVATLTTLLAEKDTHLESINEELQAAQAKLQSLPDKEDDGNKPEVSASPTASNEETKRLQHELATVQREYNSVQLTLEETEDELQTLKEDLQECKRRIAQHRSPTVASAAQNLNAVSDEQHNKLQQEKDNLVVQLQLEQQQVVELKQRVEDLQAVTVGAETVEEVEAKWKAVMEDVSSQLKSAELLTATLQEDKQHLTAELVELTEQLETLQTNLHTVEAEKAQLEADLVQRSQHETDINAQFQQQVHSLQETVAMNQQSSQEQLAALTASLAEKEQQCEAVLQELAALESTHKHLQDDLQSNQEELEQFQRQNSDIQSLQQDKEALSAEVSSLQTAVQTAQTDIAQLQSEVDGKDNEIASIREEMEELEEQITLLEEDKKALQEQVHSWEHKLHEALAEKTEELDAAQDQLEQLAELQTQLATLIEDKLEVEEKLHKVEADLQTVQAAHAAMHADKEQAQLALQQSQQALMDKQAEIDELQQEVESWQNRYESAEDQLTELHSLQAAVRSSEQQVLEITAEKDNLLDRYQQVQQEMEEVVLNMSVLKITVDQLHQENEALKQNNSTLLEEVSQLQDQHSSATEQLQQLRRTVDAQSNYHSVLAERTVLESKVSQLSAEVQGLQDVQLRYQALSQQCDDLHRQQLHYEESTTRLTTELQEVKETLTERERELQEVEEEASKKSEAKKKKDLEALRKQNERISVLQQELQALQRQHEDEKQAVRQELTEALNDVEDLQMKYQQLEQRNHQLQQQLEEQQSGASSYCVVDNNNHTASVPQLEQETAMMSELSQSSPDSPPVEQPVSNSHAEEIETLLKAKEVELTEAWTRIGELEKTISSLEAEKATSHQQLATLKSDLEKKIQQLTHDKNVVEKELQARLLVEEGVPSSPITLPTQRPNRLSSGGAEVDLESAFVSTANNAISSNSSDHLEVEKKEQAGAYVLLVQLWAFIRLYCPSLLATIGERPPRLSTATQVLLIYVTFMQLLSLYLYFTYSSHCPHLGGNPPMGV